MSGSAHNPPTPEQGGDPSMEDILASIRRILNEEEPRAAATADPAAAPATAIPTEIPTGIGGSVLDLTPAMRVAPPPDADAAATLPIAMKVPPLATSVPPMPEPRPEPAPEPVRITPLSVPEAIIPEPGVPQPVIPEPSIPKPVLPEPGIPEPVMVQPAIPEPASVKPVMAMPFPREPFVRDSGARIETPSPEAKPPSPEAKPSSLVAPAAAAAAAASMGELVRRLAGTQNVPVIRGGPTIEDLVREEIRGLLKAWLDENLPRIVERLVRAEIERVVGREIG